MYNKPIQLAIDRYGSKFEELLTHYSTNGVVYSDNRVLVMEMMHNKDLLFGKKSEKDLDKLDCWYVHYAAGDIKRLFEIAPYEMKWAVFERENQKLKCYDLDRIRRLINGQNKNSQATNTNSTATSS